MSGVWLFFFTVTFRWTAWLLRPPWPGLPEGEDDNLQERYNHGEEHPDVNHFEKGGGEEGLRDPNEAG